MTTERWNDEMLDNLADSVTELRESVEQTRESVEQTRETVEQTTHNVDILVGAVNAFLERDRERAEEFQQLRNDYLELDRKRTEEFQQYKLENDQRFNVLLDEVRFLIRKLGDNTD